MDKETPERIAKDLARRWLSHESDAMRALFERELATVIRSAANHPSDDAPRAA